MAMTPYIRSVTTKNRIKARNGTITEVPGQLAYRQQLQNVVTKTGDYVTPNPHAYTKLAYMTLTGYERDTFANGETQEITGVDLRNPNPWVHAPTQFSENIKAMALLDLYDQLRASDVDLSIDGVQWRKTVQMLALWKRTCFGIARNVRHVIPVAQKTQRALDKLDRTRLPEMQRRRQVSEIDRGLDWLAARRLEFVYGWKPTVSTFHDLAVLALHPKPNEGFLTIRGRGYQTSQKLVRQPINGLPCDHEIFMMERCVVVCKFAPANDTLERLGAISSLNPASLIYEATPYSFVLDWAVGVGGWFRSMETALMHQNNFLGGYQTRSFKWTDSVKWEGKTKSTLPNYEARATGNYRMTRFERLRLLSAPFPTRPVVNVRFGVDQALNAAALIKQSVNLVDGLLWKRK